jgi:hypothetical protein
MQQIFVEQFSMGLMAALRQFDGAIPPFGLYASDEVDFPDSHRFSPYREWDQAIKPFLVSMGALVANNSFMPPVAQFGVHDLGTARLEIFRLSKIKVRQYGSRYYVDKHVSFGERWAGLALADKIRRLWKHSDYDFLKMRVILLMAFDKSASPLQQELFELEDDLQWDKHGVTYAETHWPDIYDRGFSVGLSAWGRYSEDGIDYR